jgi:hypothetical protein
MGTLILAALDAKLTGPAWRGDRRRMIGAAGPTRQSRTDTVSAARRPCGAI